MSNRFRPRHSRDCDKTKAQLINELIALHQKIVKLEKLEAERGRSVLALQEAYEYAIAIVNTVREPMVVLDTNLRVNSANRSFYQTFQVTPEEAERQPFFNLGNRQWDISRLRKLLKDVLVKNTTFDDFEVDLDFPTIGHRRMLLNARRIHREANKARLILLAIEDITEPKQAECIAQEEQECVANRAEPLVVLDANLRVVGGDS